ncbi:O-antigen ligase family protein [Paenibacillus sp. UMB7766-LJ446]|uniref:O-antigen ligase family protein n=1 Tax=Paenibacillus sp. UMB7766-LJ446 TaxID=3046313 RepID=UPI002551C62D|nr:O-antigen ligase family protein [Paenibacillus sp. UMB7766-LJ446]MDK8193679.1 O-antigen ligase family protein [Paenibacillus sp. UMB7766-LJ446]
MEEVKSDKKVKWSKSDNWGSLDKVEKLDRANQGMMFSRLSEPALTVVLGLILVVLLLAGCLRRGLFYFTDVYPLVLMASGSALIWLILFMMCFNAPKTNGKLGISQWLNYFKRLYVALMQYAHLRWMFWPLALAIWFGLHAWIGSVSVQGSLDEMLRWSLLAIFALLTAMLASRANGARWFACGWQMAGGLFVLSGVLAACGVLPLPYGVMRTADPEISSAGARLGGLLQYPNAYGAVAGMYALERLAAAARAIARPLSAGRLIAAVLPLMPAQAALLLSESRGAWLATGSAAVAAFALQRRGARLPLLLATAAPLACAAWLYRQLAAAQLAPAPVPGLLALAGAWAAALLGTLLLCRLWHSGARARAAALTATGLAGITAAALAVSSTADRMAAGVGTGLSRLQMWRDALKLWTEAPWMGHGGETWRSMFRAIQSSPYVGGEVHNGILDLALDAGIIGLLLIAGWFFSTLRTMWRQAPRLLPSVIVFGLHGAVDFDWSFTFLWMMFIWLGGWALSSQTLQEAAAYKKRPRFFHQLIPWPQLILAGLFVIFWLGGTAWFAGHQLAADQHYRLAISNDAGSAERKTLLTAAYKFNPYRPDIAISLSRTLPAKKAELMLVQSLSYSPVYPQLYGELGQLAARSGRGESAGNYFEQAIALNRFDASSQSLALYWMEQASRRELAAGYAERGRQTASAGVRLYEKYRQLAEEVAAGKARNDRRFGLNEVALRYGDNLRILAFNPLASEVSRKYP